MVINPHKYGLHKVVRRTLPLSWLERLQHWLDAPHRNALLSSLSQKEGNNNNNIAIVRKIAQRRTPRMIFDYMDGGADDECTLYRNQQAYQDCTIVVGNSTTSSSLSSTSTASSARPSLHTTLFGKDVDLPFFACPTAGNKMFHYQGETAVAQVAAKRRTVYALSSLSTTSLEKINDITTANANSHGDAIPKVFQLYLWKDRGLVKDLLEQVKSSNFDALALTVDATWMGNRERDIRNGFTIPPDYSWNQTWQAAQCPAWTFDFLINDPYQYACINQDVPAESLVAFINQQLTPDFSWKDAEWILGEWNKQTAIKGVVRPDDALQALQVGFSTIWVSNHGGRQLDTAPATMDVLKSIRNAVGKDTEVILDGGIQSGRDIAKALAMGADGVGIGKPYLWGLCAGGYHGVDNVFEVLQSELEQCMNELQVSTIAKLKECTVVSS